MKPEQQIQKDIMEAKDSVLLNSARGVKKLLSSATALIFLVTSLYAQPQGERPEPPQMKSPAEMAKEQADRMQEELSLDKKQYKKVYNLFKKDFQYRQNAAKNNMPGGMPPQGGGPGMGGPGGGMMGGGPGMGGGFGGGMPGGMSGGMPPQGGGMKPGERPEGGPGMGPGGDVVTEEYLEKQEAKLKKILTAEQYDKWRAKHPAEHLELPPMDVTL